jgi:hypothetical protein
MALDYARPGGQSCLVLYYYAMMLGEISGDWK